MKRSFIKVSSLVAVLLVTSLALSGCATIFNNKETTVSTASGANSEVTILENGAVIFQGTLPTVINVNGSNRYTIQYNDKDGNSRTLQLEKKLSGWFVADVLLIGGWIIDIITGDVMVYDKAATIPIKNTNTQQFLLVDGMPETMDRNLSIIGNVYN